MLHMVATLVSLLLLIGSGGLIAASLGDRRAAILAALRQEMAREAPPVAPRAPRVRWSVVRAKALPQGVRHAA